MIKQSANNEKKPFLYEEQLFIITKDASITE